MLTAGPRFRSRSGDRTASRRRSLARGQVGSPMTPVFKRYPGEGRGPGGKAAAMAGFAPLATFPNWAPACAGEVLWVMVPVHGTVLSSAHSMTTRVNTRV